MGGIGGQELFLLFLVVLLVFGPKKIPEVARGLGKGLRELRRLSTDLQREVNLASALEDDEESRKKLRPGPGPPPDPTATAGEKSPPDADQGGRDGDRAKKADSFPPPAKSGQEPD